VYDESERSQRLEKGMRFFNIIAILIVISSLFAYINFRFIRLPSVIGVMLVSIKVYSGWCCSSSGCPFLEIWIIGITSIHSKAWRTSEWCNGIVNYFLILRRKYNIARVLLVFRQELKSTLINLSSQKRRPLHHPITEMILF